MAGNKVLKSTKDITLISVMTTILFVQEQLLSSLPGIQLTIFLMVLYTKTLGFTKSTLIIILHVLLDNLYMGSFSLMYTPTMLIGWLIIPLTLSTVFKKVENPISLGILAMIYSFIYSWLYVIPSYLLFKIDPILYIMSDIPFEIMLALCSFVSVLLLYNPCFKAIRSLLKEK